MIGIQTGESLFAARAKCPGLTIVPPDFDFYVKNSKALIASLNDYTPDVEQYLSLIHKMCIRDRLLAAPERRI